jgi:hypothetical protein
MTSPFTYSILQYRHSLILGEAINVGVLFQFHVEEKLEFISGNAHRLKLIYPDFDQTVYNYLIKSISKKVKDENNSSFFDFNSNSNLKKYISSNLLLEDSTVLQFQEPVTVLGNKANLISSKFIGKIVNDFSALLLPDLTTKKSEIVRHNEQFLIKQLTDFIFKKNKDLEKKLIRNKIIKTQIDNRDIELKFELAWQNGSTNFVKPLSFDLSEEKSIQEKSLVNYGYLKLLSNYAKENNYRFDFIVSEPQNKDLYKSYENALGLLDLSDAPKRIISEGDLKEYSEEAAEQLLKH